MKKVLPIICIVSSIVVGCSIPPTKPNISAIYRIPALKAQLRPLPAKSQQLTQYPFPIEAQKLFQKLYTLDPALALEVGKLPGFQGKVGEIQIRALTRFTELIANATPEEKVNLAMLLEVGKPNIRRYCAPLQALYWLLEEDECLMKNPLQCSIIDILTYAWDFNNKSRWDDFNVVTDRLNSPVLINFYQRHQLSYISRRVTGWGPLSPKSLFITKKGACSSFARFSADCLRKAGYWAREIEVRSPTGHSRNHIVCEFKDKLGQVYIMDNSCARCGSGLGITSQSEYFRKLPFVCVGYEID